MVLAWQVSIMKSISWYLSDSVSSATYPFREMAADDVNTSSSPTSGQTHPPNRTHLSPHCLETSKTHCPHALSCIPECCFGRQSTTSYSSAYPHPPYPSTAE